MSILNDWNWFLDGWIVAIGVLCAVSCSLLGNFLVLRRMSLLGDAVTHAVLPGLAIAFLITGSRQNLPMFIGAVILGVLTAFFSEWIRRHGRVDEGASMGVVFTSLFALGLVIIVQAADRVHLDADCVLHGAIELTPLETMSLGFEKVPVAAVTLGGVLLANVLFVLLFFKELKIGSFDPALAATVGIPVGVMHYALMILVAVTSVASFECVGSILVVAMFVVPPATALLLTDRLPRMIWGSVFIAAGSAVLGHLGALIIPGWWGYHSTTTAGMMAVASGFLFALAMVFGPTHGILARFGRRQLLSLRILSDDVIALLFRMEERDGQSSADVETLRRILLADRLSLSAALWGLRLQGEIQGIGRITLTRRGRAVARGLVRSHRLLERYLVDEAGVSLERVHDQAERLEHFAGRELRDRLEQATDAASVDPHGRDIPPEDAPT